MLHLHPIQQFEKIISTSDSPFAAEAKPEKMMTRKATTPNIRILGKAGDYGTVIE